MYVVNLYNIESKYYNHYIAISKCIDYKKAYKDYMDEIIETAKKQATQQQ